MVALGFFGDFNRCFSDTCGQSATSTDDEMVPLAGIEPALLAELDFESSASTNSATGALFRCADYSHAMGLVNASDWYSASLFALCRRFCIF
jgi:hypothetical protein